MNKKPILRGKKKAMIEALCSNFNITQSAKMVGIDRCTHYDWIEKDPEYKKAVDELPEKELEFYETALRRLIKDGNPAATIYALKAKGKHKGWAEKQEIEHSGASLPNNITVEVVEILKKEE